MQTLDTDAPVHHFSNCHVGIFAQLSRLGQLPDLLGPAALARKIAQQAIAFFSKGMYTHHSEEESDLFPAVHSSAQPGQERMQMDALIAQLVQDHRALEILWESLQPALQKVAKGQDSTLDLESLTALVQRYKAHAQLEEEQFLPMAETILGRNSNHMAALGLQLHMRHAPEFIAHI